MSHVVSGQEVVWFTRPRCRAAKFARKTRSFSTSVQKNKGRLGADSPNSVGHRVVALCLGLGLGGLGLVGGCLAAMPWLCMLCMLFLPLFSLFSSVFLIFFGFFGFFLVWFLVFFWFFCFVFFFGLLILANQPSCSKPPGHKRAGMEQERTVTVSGHCGVSYYYILSLTLSILYCIIIL